MNKLDFEDFDFSQWTRDNEGTLANICVLIVLTLLVSFAVFEHIKMGHMPYVDPWQWSETDKQGCK